MTMLNVSHILWSQAEIAQSKPHGLILQVAKLFHQVLYVKLRASLRNTETLRTGMETFEGIWMILSTLIS